MLSLPLLDRPDKIMPNHLLRTTKPKTKMDVLSKEFIKQLQLTMLWCQSRINPSDPANCLRSRYLRPQLDTFGYRDDNVWIHPELVGQVIRKREFLLSSSPESVPVGRINQRKGRLLLAAQDYSNHNGLTSDLTNGFFDLNDVPPWDSWVTLIHGEKQGMSLSLDNGDWPSTMNSVFGYTDLMWRILVSWVPDEFQEIVSEAIKAECIGMLAWADDLPEENEATVKFRRVLPRWFRKFVDSASS